MKCRPFHDRALIRRTAETAKTSDCIIVPDTAQEKPTAGEIAAVARHA